MRSRVHVWRDAGRALLLALALTPVAGCAGWSPLGLGSSDPMQAELRRLEKEQRRIAHEQRALEEAEDRKRKANPKTLQERLLQGDRYLADGQMASALWEYAAAHKMDPESAEPRVRLGYVHLRHEPERAQPLFESALELEPQHVSAHIGLGLSLLASRHRKEGLAHLERAVSLAPRSAKAQQALGVSLDQLGRHAEAMRHLEAAHDLQPHDSRILNNLGVAYLRSGLPDKAEEMLRAALRQDDRDLSLRATNLGMAFAMQGRFDEALKSFRRAGDEQSARSNLGYAYYLRGDYPRAIEQYEQALVVGGDSSVQVLRNLKAARHALRIGARPPAATPAPGQAPVADEGSAVVREPPPEQAGEGDDPWLWDAASDDPPAAPSELAD